MSGSQHRARLVGQAVHKLTNESESIIEWIRRKMYPF